MILWICKIIRQYEKINIFVPYVVILQVMKRAVWIVIFFICLASTARGQYKVRPNKPFSTLNTNPGFVTINEITYGIGLHGKSRPYSKYFWGLTSVNGYQVNSNFFAGAGLGLTFYDGGLLVPLFLDFRLAFHFYQFSPYIFGDGGLLLNFADLNTTKLFINPGVGVRYSLSRKLAVNAGAGLLSQVDGDYRASFINLKVGAVYVF
jgi:hypothetical protein